MSRADSRKKTVYKTIRWVSQTKSIAGSILLRVLRNKIPFFFAKEKNRQTPKEKIEGFAHLRQAFHQLLGFPQPEAGDCSHFLDHLRARNSDINTTDV